MTTRCPTSQKDANMKPPFRRGGGYSADIFLGQFETPYSLKSLSSQELAHKSSLSRVAVYWKSQFFGLSFWGTDWQLYDEGEPRNRGSNSSRPLILALRELHILFWSSPTIRATAQKASNIHTGRRALVFRYAAPGRAGHMCRSGYRWVLGQNFFTIRVYLSSERVLDTSC